MICFIQLDGVQKCVLAKPFLTVDDFDFVQVGVFGFDKPFDLWIGHAFYVPDS